MASQDTGRPLPKFGEWDVNDPASAEGFTVIFNKARDDKRTSGTAGAIASPQRNDNAYRQTETYQRPPKVRLIVVGEGGFVVGEPIVTLKDWVCAICSERVVWGIRH